MQQSGSSNLPSHLIHSSKVFIWMCRGSFSISSLVLCMLCNSQLLCHPLTASILVFLDPGLQCLWGLPNVDLTEDWSHLAAVPHFWRCWWVGLAPANLEFPCILSINWLLSHTSFTVTLKMTKASSRKSATVSDLSWYNCYTKFNTIMSYVCASMSHNLREVMYN